MPKIERRRAVVDLYQGNYEPEIVRLQDEALAAQRKEELSGERRASSRSKWPALALAHDELVAEAEKTAVKVTVWALSYTEWQEFAEAYPPRADIPAVPADEATGTPAKATVTFTEDKLHGVNMKTFPPVLLRASLADPENSRGLKIEARVEAGQKVLDELGDISQLQYRRLENAAWTVHAGDDSLPKYSLASLMAGEKEDDSEPLESGE